MPVQPIPTGFHTITPYLMASDAAKLIEFLKAALGAEVKMVSKLPNGMIMHAQLQIGDSMLMMTDAMPHCPATLVNLYMYVPNVDEAYQRAIKAGAISLNEPRNEFYGDRMAGIKDPSGNTWWLASHIEDVSPDELRARQEKMFNQKKKV